MAFRPALRRDTTTRSLMRESTDLAICNVTSSVMRSPATFLTGSPQRFISSVISGPPPCRTMGVRPRILSSEICLAKASICSIPPMEEPPNFTTTFPA
ncbi:MAG: hypothetical protein A4E30_01493 [Methanomassiliicoccales archaeon PtaB.Bin215]|nr:MAG: hypothetical protein A4E30_01493 [Methanomassiliicoccales archaeon PtaB.Bin215]